VAFLQASWIICHPVKNIKPHNTEIQFINIKYIMHTNNSKIVNKHVNLKNVNIMSLNFYSMMQPYYRVFDNS